MFLPGVPLKIKLLGITVLAVLTFSLIGTARELVEQAVAEGAGQSQYSREQFTGDSDAQTQTSDEYAVIGGLKFVCPFH